MHFRLLRAAERVAVRAFIEHWLDGAAQEHRGRVWGLGVKDVRSRGARGEKQFFRMDWHEPHGRGRSDLDYFECHSQSHPFHFHIPR